MTDEKTSDDVAEDVAEAKTDAPAAAEAEGEAKPEAASEAKADEGASPEAIARRVAALGGDDESEAAEREEERKLAARRREQSGKKKKKAGLEVAASKKLAKIGTRAEPRRSLAVAEGADPLIEKTAKLSEWAKKNQKMVQIVGGLVAVALLGLAGYMYVEHKHETEASVLLTKAVADERGRIGEPPKDDDDNVSPDPSPLFKTFDDRREAALKKYREVETSYPKTGAAILARLAEGSLLLDKHDPDKAIAAFNDVKGSPLAAADLEVKGRTLEGLGFAYELKAQATPAEAPKFLDQAAATYKELEDTVEVRGFKELAMYHRARVAQARGEKDKAKELLVSLKERLDKSEDVTSASSPNAPPPFPFLREVAMDRLREIDPTLAPKTPPPGPGAGGKLSPAQIRKMIEDAQKKQKSGGAPPDPRGGH